MNSRQTAALLAPREFVMICSYLDAKYFESARTFEVLSVQRQQGRLYEVSVLLNTGERVTLNAQALGRRAA